MKTTKELLEAAIELHQTGEFDKAEVMYKELLKRDPRNADALNLLGVIATQRGRFPESKELLQKALALKPEHPAVLLNLGNAHRGLKEFSEAQRCYEQTIRIKPDYSDGFYNLGLTQRDLGLNDKAIASLREAIRLNPQNTEARLTCAETLIKAERNDEAATELATAIKTGPIPAAMLMRTGSLFLHLGILDKAESCFLTLVQGNPVDSNALNALGLCRYNLGKLLDALSSLSKAVEIAPSFSAAWHNIAAVHMDMGSPCEAENCFRKALVNSPAGSHAHSYLLYCLNFMNDRPAERIYQEHRAWADAVAAALSPDSRFNPAKSRNRSSAKVRIGYVSGDFRLHSVAFFMEAILANYDRTSFETVCYSDCEKPDAITERFEKMTGEWHDIHGISDADLADRVRADKIDILIDLAGHTRENRLLAFARKPAPVLATYLGYPNTTGLTTIDYRISDEYADPTGTTEHLHSEKLIRLQGCFLCYTPSADAPAVGPLPFIEKGHITFGCFNNLAKVNPLTIKIWADILRRIPASRLFIKARPFNDPRFAGRWRELFVQQGIDGARIELVGRIASQTNHLALYNSIDIALDTFPYNGTTTTFEALLMGVPVISLAGKVHASRVGKSILTNLGNPELCADSEEEFVQKAVGLALDIGRLAALRESLRLRLEKSVLCEGKRFTENLERVYREMISGC